MDYFFNLLMIGNKMTSNKKTALSNMAETLVNPKGKTNPKKDKTPAVIPESQLVEFGVSLGNAYLGMMTASESLNALVQSVIKTGFKPIDLRKAKTDPKGAKATKIFKQSFLDTLNGKVSAKVAQNYYELVSKSIVSGKAITDTNPNRPKNSQKSKGGKGADDSTKMTSALLNVWKLSDVAPEALETIEANIDNGMNLIEAIADYLKLQGEDLSTGEAEA
jgi:hypothetical protein